MTSAQTPQWISFALTGIALVGPLGAAWFASWRDDKRWMRERDREDLRYERERQRLADERVHVQHIHWRDQRLGVYSEFVATLFDWWSALVGVNETSEGGRPVSGDQKEKLAELRMKAGGLFATIAILGSEQVRKRAAGAMHHFGSLHNGIVEEESGESAGPLYLEVDSLNVLIRAELGITESGLSIVPLSPSPPSGPTS